MGKLAPVYLTAVLEYLTAEVLEQAGLISKLLKLDRVTPQSIRLAIREDKGEIVFQSTILLFRIRIWIVERFDHENRNDISVVLLQNWFISES